jgi:hypothetical protein
MEKNKERKKKKSEMEFKVEGTFWKVLFVVAMMKFSSCT